MMRVQDVMTANVATISSAEPAESAWNLMRLKAIHHLVVTEGSQVVGIFSARDAGGRGGKSVRQGRTVSELMTSPALSVPPETTVRKAANLMRGRAIGCLVITRGARPIGIVTVSDLLEVLGRGSAIPAPKEQRHTLHHRVPHRKQDRSGRAW
jgi:signal-transduction protein with cAMP-binding, CBS, and nucleotidyltransferase domain